MSDHTASRSARAEAQRERARKAESEVERLKAENASLLESLRAAEKRQQPPVRVTPVLPPAVD